MEHVDKKTTDPYSTWWNVASLLRVTRGERTTCDHELAGPHDSREEDLSGTMLSGKYLLLARRGVGGMGNVYEARNTFIDRRVAIKILHRVAAGRVPGARRFHREAIATARIRHPNIVDVFDMGHTRDGRPYLVMEFLDGQDLHTMLGQSRRLFSDVALGLVDQVLAGLSAAHRSGIVHRDLKPENVFLIEGTEDCAQVKLLDFGAAMLRDEDGGTAARLTREGAVVGTPWYMSPEQASGGEIDHRADLYAVGVLLFEMLSGGLPHPCASRREAMVAVASRPPRRLDAVAPGLPAALVDVVHRALARRPEDRFASAEDFREALCSASPRRIPGTHPPRLVRTEPFLLVRRRPKRLRWALAGLVAGALIAATPLLDGRSLVRPATWLSEMAALTRIGPSRDPVRAAMGCRTGSTVEGPSMLVPWRGGAEEARCAARAAMVP